MTTEEQEANETFLSLLAVPGKNQVAVVVQSTIAIAGALATSELECQSENEEEVMIISPNKKKRVIMSVTVTMKICQ